MSSHLSSGKCKDGEAHLYGCLSLQSVLMRVDGGLCGTSDGLHAGRESVEEEMEEEEAKAKA